MRIKRIFFILFLFLLIITTKTYAQKNDAGLWASFCVEKRVTKKISLNFEPELRLNNNFQNVNSLIGTFGVEYRILKQLHVGVLYRFTNKYLITDNLSFRHRFIFDASYKQSILNFDIQYRSRIQSEYKDYQTSETGEIPEYVWRHKISASYSVEKFEPYIATEFFLQLSAPKAPEINGQWTAIRYSVGLDYKIVKRNSFGLYYLLEQEYNVKNPCTLSIVGVQYKWVIK